MTTEPRHPLTGEPTNEARAARVEEAIRQYAQECYGGLDHEAIATIVQDFISDALHWAVQHQDDDADPIGPSEIVHAALHHVEEEISMEKGREVCADHATHAAMLGHVADYCPECGHPFPSLDGDNNAEGR